MALVEYWMSGPASPPSGSKLPRHDIDDERAAGVYTGLIDGLAGADKADLLEIRRFEFFCTPVALEKIAGRSTLVAKRMNNLVAEFAQVGVQVDFF
ncbi:hypothetical protein UG46_09060 [Pseudomonas fluorescens]|nr:hypothetical protein UG46_09060 [Pseudomonas fluorescens]